MQSASGDALHLLKCYNSLRTERRATLIADFQEALALSPPQIGVVEVRLIGPWAADAWDACSEIDLLVLTDRPGVFLDTETLPYAQLVDVLCMTVSDYRRFRADGHTFQGRDGADAVVLWPMEGHSDR